MAITLREAMELSVHVCVACTLFNLISPELHIPTPRRNWKDHIEHMKLHPLPPEDCDCAE